MSTFWHTVPDDARLIRVTPSPRQLKHSRLQFYGFIHFTVNTFTDREWGDGTESPSVFHPTSLDARQWVSALKSAGMRGLILTCKHHDGFCLWPSRFTDHSVASSPFRGGHGDVVREVSDACHDAGLAFGVYLSPWDRHSQLYGQGKPYDDYFVSQLEELLTGYGEIFSVWFDGACGEGPNGKKQVYDWDRYYETVRRLQPSACISVCGPDVRWCGNEAGQTRPSEWSVVPLRTRDTEKIQAKSQQQDDDAFRARPIRAQDLDLGSRDILRNEPDLIWYPAEVNTSIRPGWFWHEAENAKVKTLEELLSVYERSVGGNATFLLNVPPNRDGLIQKEDMERLQEMGNTLRDWFRENLLASSDCKLQVPGGDGSAENLLCSENRVLALPEGTCTATWSCKKRIRLIFLQEAIECSQRIEQFSLDILSDGTWAEVFHGTTVGSGKIVRLSAEAEGIRLRVTDSRGEPQMRHIGVYA